MGSQGFQRQYKPNNPSVFFIKYPHLEQLNSEFFVLLSIRLSTLKIDHLIKRIGIISHLFTF